MIFHLIAFKRQKKVDRKYKKILLLVIADQRFPTYFLSSWEFFLLKLEKNLSRENFKSCSIHASLNKGEICVTHSIKIILWTCRQIKKDSVLNEDEILARKVKKYPCLYDKSSRSYQDRLVVRNSWVEVAKKLEFLEDGKCC